VLGAEASLRVTTRPPGRAPRVVPALPAARSSLPALTPGDCHDAVTLAAAAAGQLGPALRAMLADVAFARSAGFGSAYARPEGLTAETVATYLGPLVASPEALRNLERFLATFDNAQTVAVYDRLRRLEVPTLIM
jgi:hypothetical protein